jgi:hypothetical protein
LRWHSLVRRRRLEQELDEELRFHLDEQTAENLVGAMSAQQARYAARRAIGGAMVDRVGGLPGVRSAAVSESSLAGGSVTTSAVFVPGYTPKPNENTSAMEDFVDPGYFATVGMQLLSGRDFDRRDGPQAQQVAIVNEAMAWHCFGTLAAPGRSYRYGAQGRDFKIIGVVRDAKIRDAWGDAAPMAYRPLRQQMDYVHSLEVRTAGEARAVGQVRQAITEVTPNLPVLELTTPAEHLDRTLTDGGNGGDCSPLRSFLAAAGVVGNLRAVIVRGGAENRGDWNPHGARCAEVGCTGVVS